jgi:hypothetical protein
MKLLPGIPITGEVPLLGREELIAKYAPSAISNPAITITEIPLTDTFLVVLMFFLPFDLLFTKMLHLADI